MATAINDFIQGIIMIFGICAVIAAVLHSQGGFMAALEGLAQIQDPEVSQAPGVFASFFGPDPLNLLGVVLLTSLGTWGLPQMVQKFYAIKSEEAIHKGTIISTLFALVISGGCYFLGGFGAGCSPTNWTSPPTATTPSSPPCSPACRISSSPWWWSWSCPPPCPPCPPWSSRPPRP